MKTKEKVLEEIKEKNSDQKDKIDKKEIPEGKIINTSDLEKHAALKAYTTFCSKLIDLDFFDPIKNFTEDDIKSIAESKKEYENATKEYNEYKSKILKTKKGLSIKEEKIKILEAKYKSLYKAGYSKAMSKQLANLDFYYQKVRECNVFEYLEKAYNSLTSSYMPKIEYEISKIKNDIKNKKDELNTDETILDITRGMSNLTYEELLNKTSPEIRKLEQKLTLLTIFHNRMKEYEKDLLSVLNQSNKKHQ